MRFLIDENLPQGIISFLASLKHDVFDVSVSPLRGASDQVLWAKAAEEKRIIITRDLDYPIIGLRPVPYSVILVRVPSNFRADQIARIFKVAFKQIRLEDIKNKVVVIEPGRIRISPLP